MATDTTAPFTTRPELLGTFGMVATTHWLASVAGMTVLEKGGNAFDAAVAAGLVLEVVEPNLNGPGGEVPIILYSAARDDVLVINGQGPAPRHARIDHFRDLGLDLVPGSGLLPACVPGAFGAWMLLLRDFGTVRLSEVMGYAIGYAADGWPVTASVTDDIRSVEDLFRTEWTDSAELYLRDGIPEPGATFRNPALARTFNTIVKEAEDSTADRDGQITAALDAFYRGFVAEAISDYLARAEVMDTSGRRHRGLLTGDDLAAWEPTEESAVTFDYGRYTVSKTGPWGQGPVFLQQLSLLAGFDLNAMGHNSADYVHTIVECAKLAFADREAWYGDPLFVNVPLRDLLDPAYADERRSLIGPRASYELRPGSVGKAPALSLDRSTPAPVAPSPGDTCHVNVVDRHGNMVAATPSGGWLQSSPVVPELGFCLGTRGQMFSLREGHPNSLEGGKRPRSTLSPSIALSDGRPYLAFGTPGGDAQDQWTLNFFLAHVHFGLNLQEAIDAPTFHTTHFPGSFYPREAHPGETVVESRIAADVIEELRARGHRIVSRDAWSLGRVTAAGKNRRSGLLMAAASPRGMAGYAVGR